MFYKISLSPNDSVLIRRQSEKESNSAEEGLGHTKNKRDSNSLTYFVFNVQLLPKAGFLLSQCMICKHLTSS